MQWPAWTRSASTRLREQMRRQMAAALHDDWAWAFEQHQVRAGYQPTATQSGRARWPTWRCACCAWTP
jgi:hypothetical protein